MIGDTYSLRCKAIFEPYSRHITLERLLNWLLSEAQRRNISNDTAELAMIEILLEISEGKTFSKDGCKCGCELTNEHSALAHYMRKRMVELDAREMRRHLDRIEDKFARRMLKISRKKSLFFDWSKSPTVKAGRWLFGS